MSSTSKLAAFAIGASIMTQAAMAATPAAATRV
jgi:hypothetical protein